MSCSRDIDALTATPSFEPHSDPGQLRPDGLFTTSAPATFDNVALVSAALGGLCGSGLCVLFRVPRVGAYMIATGVFHLLEFWITARLNAEKLTMASFLLKNGVVYLAAQLLAAGEIAARFFYDQPTSAYAALVGPSLVTSGQLLRSTAMVQASNTFSHFLETTHRRDHVLLYRGTYSLMRHPSYAGFYMWAVGAQVMVGNVCSTVLFAAALQFFFVQRIRAEEKYLVSFFGDEYLAYRAHVWSGIPFIR